jgi:hypothetical protein
MHPRKILSIVGSSLIATSAFGLPILRVPLLGTLNYIHVDRPGAIALLALAGVGFGASLLRGGRIISALLGVATLGVFLHSYVELRNAAAPVHGAGLARLAAASLLSAARLDIGVIVLVIGAFLLLVSAGLRSAS